MLKTGEPAPDVRLGSRDGEVALSELWREGPVVVAFLRHFG